MILVGVILMRVIHFRCASAFLWSEYSTYVGAENAGVHIQVDHVEGFPNRNERRMWVQYHQVIEHVQIGREHQEPFYRSQHVHLDLHAKYGIFIKGTTKLVVESNWIRLVCEWQWVPESYLATEMDTWTVPLVVLE